MCLLQNINIIGLKPVFISVLPLLIALYFGNYNAYKILFLLLIGYILLFILIILNSFEIVVIEGNTNYERNGEEGKHNLYFFYFFDKMIKPAITEEEIKGYEFECIYPINKTKKFSKEHINTLKNVIDNLDDNENSPTQNNFNANEDSVTENFVVEDKDKEKEKEKEKEINKEIIR